MIAPKPGIKLEYIKDGDGGHGSLFLRASSSAIFY